MSQESQLPRLESDPQWNPLLWARYEEITIAVAKVNNAFGVDTEQITPEAAQAEDSRLSSFFNQYVVQDAL